jgi:Transposase DDE domain
MYKPNQKHLQPLLISNVNDLPEEQRQRLESSWAGEFYREFFCRIREETFAVLYADVPSRPNTPINVLLGLETLKAGYGWSDEELYDHFTFDLQVRYALGYHGLHEGHFELRTLYYFRQRLSKYNQEHGLNLVAQAFEDITDQQMVTLKVKASIQRMDSTQIASNILDMSRLQLLVEGLQRLWRVLSEAEKQSYDEWLGEYVKNGSGQYVYRVKGKEATAAHTLQVGQVIHRLLDETKAAYEKTPVYQVLERLFQENFNLTKEGTQVKPNEEIGAGCLQSIDDQEATFRRKGPAEFKGYVANLTQTCEDDNPVQLITKVQVASNNVDDADLLIQAVPGLKKRTGLETLYTDGAYGSPAADEQMIEQNIELFQTGIRGGAPVADKLNLSQFDFTTNEKGKPLSIACPNGQAVAAEPGRTTGYIARFAPQICQTCPFALQNRCRAIPGKRDPSFKLSFTQREVNWAKRRKRFESTRHSGKNPRAAIEAVARSVKHPFPAGKLPVRGLFRATCMVVASAAMSNIRSILRFRQQKTRENAAQNLNWANSFLAFVQSLQLFSFRLPCFSC